MYLMKIQISFKFLKKKGFDDHLQILKLKKKKQNKQSTKEHVNENFNKI